MTKANPAPGLSEDLLDRIAARAPGYDAANAFFAEDLDELRAAGYLRFGVPEAQGGADLGLAAMSAVQQRLAQAAPATALGARDAPGVGAGGPSRVRAG